MVSNFARQFAVKHRIGPCRVVAAVSGGADSTALLLALAEMRAEGFEILCAHVNHRLRGAESDTDQEFVAGLCARLGVELVALDGTLSRETVRHRGIEAAAREVRYARLTSAREAWGAPFVATAHQRNDQAETVLMRLLTGGGLSSLRGIRAVREDGFIRPLLEATREQLAGFLTDRGIEARIDRSNADPRFLRNRVRALLAGTGAVDPLAAFAGAMQRAWPLLEEAIDCEEARCALVLPDETRFVSWPDDLWMRRALIHRHVVRLDPAARAVSAADLGQLAATAETLRRASVTRDLELIRLRSGGVSLRRRPSPVPPFDVPLAPGRPARIPVLGLTLHVAQAAAGRRPRDGGRQLIEIPSVDGAFKVRSRRAGDRFHPLGLPGPKKLKEFLIDRKIPAEERDRLPLLLWNDEIAWIAGVEVSERFKVSTPGGVLYEVWTEDAGAADVGNHSGVHR